MNRLSARATSVALLIALASGAAAAREPSEHPAIATGLAIPIDLEEPEPAEVPARGRAVLVDAASARLFMIEDGTVVDSMRVIVGKPGAATPTVRSMIYYATLNPYWNVPVDLARTIIAPRVLAEGTAYLDARGYEVVTSFEEDADVRAAESVDWSAVAEGRERVYVRQRPGPANSMGEVKIGFANNHGIFLHDTPKKALFAEENRDLSNGCVRLEDAARFAEWLLGRSPDRMIGEPERRVGLPHPVPIVIAYLEEDARLELALR